MLEPASILSVTAHRPWPLPETPWFMFQQWSDLLFAHWSFTPETIRSLVPEEFELDLYDGKAWVGLTPFRMTDIHLRGLPPIPGAGSFLEMNLRTYVRRAKSTGKAMNHGAPGSDPADREEKPGIFFFSLDASNLPAVVGARVGFGLPYFWSDMSCVKHGESLSYSSARRGGSTAEVQVDYSPTGPLLERPTDLELFLTERYCLYELRGGEVMRTDIHHLPWPLRRVHAEFHKLTIGQAHQIPLTMVPDLIHFSAQQDVVVFPPAVAK